MSSSKNKKKQNGWQTVEKKKSHKSSSKGQTEIKEGCELREDFLQSVADQIHAKNCRAVFRGLIFTTNPDFPGSADVMIGDIENNYPKDVREQKYQMLKKWKETMGAKATQKILKTVCEKHGCRCDFDEAPTPPASPVKPKYKETGARPKERPPKPMVQLLWQGETLYIQRGTNQDTQQTCTLKGRVPDTGETSDPVKIADAMLASIINPNNSDELKYQMKLGEVKERFTNKYGKELSFTDIGVGNISSFVQNKSSCLELADGGTKVREIVQVSDRDSEEDTSEVESDMGSELGSYKTASEMSSICPSPSAFSIDEGEQVWDTPRKKKHRKSKPHATVSESHDDKKYCRKLSADEVKRMLGKCTGSHLLFRTEEEYDGETGSMTFTKDVVSLWNTPRKGQNSDAHIIVGVKPNTSPPHEWQGLKSVNKLDQDYQVKFMTESFLFKPQFMYYEVEDMDTVFGIVCIANAMGCRKVHVCYAVETTEEWSQNDIWYRDGTKCLCAMARDQDHIYAWFHKLHQVTTPPKGGIERDWEEFIEKLDVENYHRRNYCLVTNHCPTETPDLLSLAFFPWNKVWDFDPDSRENGLLALCEASIQDRLSVRTWNDSLQPSPSNSCIDWVFVRGMRKREDSLVLGSAKEWGKQVREPLNAQCDQLSKICENKPLTVVVLWYGSGECTRHLHKALGKIDECLCDITYVVCMQHLPKQEDDRDAIKELIKMLEIPKVIEIPLERLCFGFRKLDCCQKHSSASHELPGNFTVKSRDAQWLQQELDVLYQGEFSAENQSSDGDAFLRGGNLTWQEIELNIFDAERTIFPDLQDRLLDKLHKGFSGIVTLFHAPGAGGTTLSRRILWNIHSSFPCVSALADVIDPGEILQRLEFMYQKTHKPILLLVDGQELRLVKELYEMSQDIHIVILSVQRYTMEIRQRTGIRDKFWLKGEVDSKEAVRFRNKFASKCSGEKRKNLDKLEQDVKEKVASHYVYEFGLTVYNTEYIGLQRYVSGYLELKQNVDLTNWQKAVVYLALAFYYGHKGIPCQFFSVLFGKKESEVVTADEVLTHSGKQFVLEDTRKCTWRITHHAVAKEILEQALGGDETRNKDTHLSPKARRNLKKLAKEFLTYCCKKQQHFRNDPASALMRLVRDIFIHRDYKDTGQDEATNKRERHSRLISDIPCTNTSKDQLELMEHLVECFPDDPTCVSHLGRANILFKQDYETAEKYFKRAMDLRLEEIKGNKGRQEADSILCTIHHHLGILFHERLKDLIGGGKLGDASTYKCSLDKKEDIPRDIQRHVRMAISHFSKCRQYRTVGMDTSYGYIGEIKVRLHLADFVERSYSPGGYYGFLESEHSSELKELVESCFIDVENLLREYKDMMPDTSHAENEVLDMCQNWFRAIFHDAESALKFWEGREGVESNRCKIAVYKLKHQRGFKEASPMRRTAAQVLKSMRAEDLENMIKLYEAIFHECHVRSVRTNISAELKDWLVAIRNVPHLPRYSMVKRVLPLVEKCFEISPSSVTVLYYLFVLNTTLGILTQQKLYLAESNRLSEKLKKKHSEIHRLYRKYAWEWLGSDKDDSSICRVVHRSSLGVWDSEQRFWKDENMHSKLQVCTGVITDCKRPLHGHIGVTTGSLAVGHHSGSLQAVFVPKLSQLYGKNYLNTEVEFYIGFNIEHGIEAYNVMELKKYSCSHCKITVTVSRLSKPVRKVCKKCGHAVRIPADSE